jgi:hypothetical protein
MLNVAGELPPARPGNGTADGRFTVNGALHSGGAHPPEISSYLTTIGPTPQSPFDPSGILDNLRRERYALNNGRPVLSSRPVRQAYYGIRPLLPVCARKHIQQFFLRDWRSIAFPRWPVDSTVEQILERLLMMHMKAANAAAIPFIWFWPDGARGCIMLTHDVETPAGAAFVPRLMETDDAFGFKASFQIIPEKQYPVSPALLELIRARGYEVNVQDLAHDGNLFDGREQFLRRAKSINRYLKEYGARGFRAGRLYRNADWYEAIDMDYDMSIPNVAHLEAQRGGCCTVFPYFIGNILELPVTTTQDYSLFHVLGDFSIGLWKKQLSLIMARHGLASFIVHPDYIQAPKTLDVYKQLLRYLGELREEKKVWAALPREVNRWWRARSRMSLRRENGNWVVRGEGSERARIAYARIVNDRLVYTVDHL